MKIFKNTISALAVLSLLVGGFFINTGTALAAAAPSLYGSMTFANRTVPVFGNTVTFDLIGVTNADLALLGNISLYSNTIRSTSISFKINSPTSIYSINLKTGNNAINTPTLFGKYMTASELISLAASYGGTIPVTGTITNVEPSAANVTFNMAVTANFSSYNAALNSVIQANYTPTSWTTYQTVVTANVMTTANTQAQVDTATAAITTAQGSLITLVAQLATDQATALVVTTQIGALPNPITINDAAAISAARSAYTVLSTIQQGMVTNFAVLTAAETTIVTLQAAALALTNATTAVTTAEGSKLQADVNTAQALVSALPVADQVALQARINAVQAIINANAAATHTPIRTRTFSGGSSIQSIITTIPTVNTSPALITTKIIKGEVLGAESFNFTLPIKIGSKGNEIMELQKFLNGHNFIIALTGPGSTGKETTTFGPMTKKALAKFQVANKLKGDGVVGPTTRAFLNK